MVLTELDSSTSYFNLSVTPSLKPEESKGLGIGIEQPLADRQLFLEELYFKKIENFIEYN